MIKKKYVYSRYGIIIDSAGSWNFGNDFARNVIIFGVDNSSSSHSDNCKNMFLILGEGPTFWINGSFGSPKKRLKLILLKQPQNFVWIYVVMLIIVICLLMEKKSQSLNPTIKMLTFQLNFVSEVSLIDLVLLSLEKYL